MKKTLNLNTVEYKLTVNLSLIEIAKKYCEAESDKSSEILSLYSLMDIILKNQCELLRMLDCVKS